MPCGHDALPYREWLHSAAAQFGDKLRRRRVREDFALAVGWPTQNRAVLRNDSIEERVLRENLLQFGSWRPVAKINFRPEARTRLRASTVLGPQRPSWAIVPS